MIPTQYGYSAFSYAFHNPGYLYWFSKKYEACIAYVRVPFNTVVAAPPACSHECLSEVVSEFLESFPHTVFFGCDDVERQLMNPKTSLLIGKQPVWPMQSWNLEKKPSLRAQLNRARHKGVEVRRCQDPSFYEDYVSVKKQWLAGKSIKHFTFLGNPDSNVLDSQKKIWVALHHGNPIEFLVACPMPAQNAWLIEQMPRIPGSPNGSTELLLHTAFMDLNRQHRVTLGIAPLYGCEDVSPLWVKCVFKAAWDYGGWFYSFKGLAAFKSKFEPLEWERLYIVVPGERFSVRTFLAVFFGFLWGKS